MRTNPARLVAACIRCRCLAITVLSGDQVLEVVSHRLDSAKRRGHAADFVSRLVNDYAPEAVVLETEKSLSESNQLPTYTKYQIHIVTLAQAKRTLLTGNDCSHRTLFQHLLRQHPNLQRLVKVLPITDQIAMTERWRTVSLLAVALGLAAQASLSTTSKEHRPTRTHLT